MDNPNEDTEWNDILRQHKILPPKKEVEVSEEQLAGMLEETIREKRGGGKAMDSMGLDELDELEDEEDERVLLEYKKKRLAEMKVMQERNKFGELVEITGPEYVQQVNKAGEGVWVVLHLYKHGIPLCSLVNRHLTILAKKFRATKFLCSISTMCIPNFPDRNLPTIFIYLEEEIKGQICGPMEFGGMNLTQDELEWKLSEIGALKTELEENPWKRRHIHDVMKDSILGTRREDADDED